ncbi:cytochrome c-type biogenesis protein [Hydrogenophaga sp. PBL-H3]|uniref:cytochrome c-type biogenesis protein n=1 Tax=Hydrogenophaga sp. PBL-H3 TaxID=434010 RepID=UPI0013201D21|nr:cytochrome c-type biogenesis protein [Hydrogenophaga sp. PBL-H3]QHE76830.1 cytochrome c-type biogenesis protein CcmH [Hydrogenophaga sp. PBL-H3]QHE81254.1 cytochrome c-type biogenesis protein CcmH [Hydrogenophaga sp. PBL-H3]
MRVVLITVMLCWALGPGGLTAQVPPASRATPLAADPALEARVLKIAEELRCLVCQNETIAASQADLAKDLRQQIREQLTQGRTQPQILDFMAQRYGDFVLYRPPLKFSTVLLWVGPFVLLLVAAGVLLMHIRRRDPQADAMPLTLAEGQRAQRLLDEAGGSS